MGLGGWRTVGQNAKILVIITGWSDHHQISSSGIIGVAEYIFSIFQSAQNLPGAEPVIKKGGIAENLLYRGQIQYSRVWEVAEPIFDIFKYVQNLAGAEQGTTKRGNCRKFTLLRPNSVPGGLEGR